MLVNIDEIYQYFAETYGWTPAEVNELTPRQITAMEGHVEMQRRCDTCTFWADYGNGTGECSAMNRSQPESLVDVVLYRKDNGTWVVIDDHEYEIGLVTPADFQCAMWQEKNG